MGYEKKKKIIQDVVALKADLDRIDDDNVEVVEIECIRANSGYDCMEPYKGFAFWKKDSFGVVAEKLWEFQSDVLSQHPELREKRKVDDVDFVGDEVHLWNGMRGFWRNIWNCFCIWLLIWSLIRWLTHCLE